MSFAFNPLYGTLDLVGEGGDVFGPSSATDNAVARYDGTSGKLIQNSKAYLQDGGGMQAQSFIYKKLVDDNVLIPDRHAVIVQEMELTTGDVTLEGDGEVTFIN